VIKLTSKVRQTVLEQIEAGETISNVASAAGVSRQALYKLKKIDEGFAAKWDEAAAIGVQIQLAECEQAMDYRGRLGWLEPKYHEGKIVGAVRRYSDNLLLARVKALAKRAGDRSYIDRADVTSADERMQGGIIALPTPCKSEAEWEELFGDLTHSDDDL
jgi:hypothetical protein